MIDSKAIVSSNSKIGNNVRIDAFAIIEDDVEIADNCWIASHSVIRSHTRLGCNNRIHEFAVLGGDPQSIHYGGESSTLVIGDHNNIREFVTISRGTERSTGVTSIGSHNTFMAYSHIAHDCEVGDYCTFVNGTNLAGHVTVADFAFLGGFTLIHQNCRIGTFCMTGIKTVLRQDVAPYVTVSGDPAQAVSINSRGLRRHNCEDNSIRALKKVFHLYFRKNRHGKDLKKLLDQDVLSDHRVKHLIEFVLSSERGIVR